MDKKVRWAIVGCAGIAIGKMIPSIQASQTGEVIAIASRGIEKAEKTAAQLGIPRAYGSYEELLEDQDIDAVYIPLPNHLHREWTIRAARAGKHVLCEKPLALNADEATEMVQACAQAGVLLAEAFMYRHHPRYSRIKEILASGEIGDIRGIHGTFTFNSAGQSENVRFHKWMGGGALYDVGCYPINAARFLLDQEPEAATMHALFSDRHDGVDMMATGMLEFAGGVGVTFDCAMWADFRNTIEILGTDGRVILPNAFLYGSVESAAITVIAKGQERIEQVADLNQYTVQVDDFGRAILHGEAMRFSPEDSVRNMRVIDACLRSATERVRVALS